MTGRLAGLSAVKREAYRRLRSRAAGPLVTMRHGDGPGLVLVHPVGGALLCYMPLLARLPRGMPVVGFAADEPDEELTDDARIAGLAACYLAALDQALPWLYAGWSFGGAVAYEMGRAAGRPVLMIDTDPNGREPGITPDEATIRWYFAHDLARLVGVPEAEIRRARAGAASSTVADLLRQLGVQADLTDSELAARYRLFAANTRALSAYRPGRYDGPVTWVGPPRPAGNAWTLYCPGLRVHEVPGTDHYTLLDAAHVDVVAGHVVATLTEDGRDGLWLQ